MRFAARVRRLASPLALALLAALALDTRAGCPLQEPARASVPAGSGALSECALSCSARAYRRLLLQRRDARTVRFSTATAGKQGGHCWPTEVMRDFTESLQHAYIVLPVDMELAAQESLSLRPTCPGLQDALKPHRDASAVCNDCGLIFDVTTFFSSTGSLSVFCIEIVPQLSHQGSALKCPPFLVTTWFR